MKRLSLLSLVAIGALSTPMMRAMDDGDDAGDQQHQVDAPEQAPIRIIYQDQVDKNWGYFKLPESKNFGLAQYNHDINDWERADAYEYKAIRGQDGLPIKFEVIERYRLAEGAVEEDAAQDDGEFENGDDQGKDGENKEGAYNDGQAPDQEGRRVRFARGVHNAIAHLRDAVAVATHVNPQVKPADALPAWAPMSSISKDGKTRYARIDESDLYTKWQLIDSENSTWAQVQGHYKLVMEDAYADPLFVPARAAAAPRNDAEDKEEEADAAHMAQCTGRHTHSNAAGDEENKKEEDQDAQQAGYRARFANRVRGAYSHVMDAVADATYVAPQETHDGGEEEVTVSRRGQKGAKNKRGGFLAWFGLEQAIEDATRIKPKNPDEENI